MASTSFHEQPGQRPPPIPPPSAQMMIQAAAQAAAQNAKTPESLMLYYQSMAEKCWGLNSPPGSDSSTNSQGGIIKPVSPTPVSSQAYVPKPVFSRPSEFSGQMSQSLMMSGLFPPVATLAAAQRFAAQQTQQSPVISGNNQTGQNRAKPKSPTKIPRVGHGQVTCNCGIVFPSLEILEHHAKEVHPENTNLPCTVCSKQFPNLPKLQRHMANHADGPDLRKFKCTTCLKAFKFKHHLKEHERIHSGEKPFECRHCGKRFSHSGSYSSHTTSKKCLQLGRRPNMTAASNTQQPQPPPKQPLMNSEQKWKKDLPLSPPLTPLPANLRFPHLGPMMNPYHHLLLAAQYQQQLMPRPPQELMVEQLQRLFQLRNGLEQPQNHNIQIPVSQPQTPQDLVNPSVEQPAVTPALNNNNLVKKDEEIKREEAMVEDEMKEDEEDEVDDNEDGKKSDEKPNNMNIEGLKQFQLNFWLKKMYEDLKKKGGSTDSSLVEATSKGEPQEINPGHDHDEESLMSENNDTECNLTNINTSMNSSSGDERKVRVRTLISDEQLSILKAHYNKNPRPKREELERISEQIGHPFKVVKVWFQNSRARDRREGKPVVNSPGNHLPYFNELGSNPILNAAAASSGLFPRLPMLGPMMKPSLSPRSKSPYSTASDEVAAVTTKNDQPLDLSNKGSSPSVSPISTKDEDEALNLTQNSVGGPNMDLLEHFRRAAAAMASISSSTVDGGAASVVTSAPMVTAVSNLSHRPLQDIYRYQEDLETSGSAGSGGATTDEEGRFTCEKCDKTFTKQSSLSRHKYEHSDQRPHQCDECKKAFKHKHHLVEHKRLHSGEKPFECKKCFKRFSHSGSYSQHVNHRYSSCKPPKEVTSGLLLENTVINTPEKTSETNEDPHKSPSPKSPEIHQQEMNQDP